MKNKKIKHCLLALACAVAIVLPGVPVNAAGAQEAALMSARLTGSCGCTMIVKEVSKRNCVNNFDGTHTAEYFVTYSCPHGEKSQSEYIKETHSFSGPYSIDKGHDKDDSRTHVYARKCSCGAEDLKKVTCYASPNATGGHAVP